MIKTLAFFNNKSGVGKTTVVYHLAHMLAERGQRILVVDLDPQSNLTAMCVDEERLEALWADSDDHPETVLSCVRPALRGLGEIGVPHLEEIRPGLALVPGDLGLSIFEDKLADAWPRALDGDEAAYRTLAAFHHIAQQGGAEHRADLVIIDLGPNLGAINRAALLASEFVITPLAPDLFSMQGIRNLGPTLTDWRQGWKGRLERCRAGDIDLPAGRMEPLGYLVMQAGMRLSRPVVTYRRWIERLPQQYHESLLDEQTTTYTIDDDPHCLGIMRQHQSLMPLAQDARKPMFDLRPGDGAIGAHSKAVARCHEEFGALADKVRSRLESQSALSLGGGGDVRASEDQAE